MKFKISNLILVCFIFLSYSLKSQNGTKQKNFYYGQTIPGKTPEVFCQGVISTPNSLEYCIAFSPDLREIYFNRAGQGVMFTQLKDTSWTNPVKAPFNKEFPGGEVHITPDGKYLLMNRFGKLNEGEKRGIYALSRKNDTWAEPEFCAELCMRATSTKYGDIYTTDITGFMSDNADKGDIIKYVRSDSGYLQVPLAENKINSVSTDSHPFIAADESYLIFNSDRTGGKGESDLYICFRTKSNTWSKPINMEHLNSESADWCATVSPDGKYLFFTRNSTGRGDIFWVDAEIIEQYCKNGNY